MWAALPGKIVEQFRESNSEVVYGQATSIMGDSMVNKQWRRPGTPRSWQQWKRQRYEEDELKHTKYNFKLKVWSYCYNIVA